MRGQWAVAFCMALVASCGASAAPTRQASARAPSTPPVPSAPAEVVRSPAERQLAALTDGTALLCVDVDEAERRLVFIGPAEVTEANEGETIETWFGGVRLEDGAAVAAPRTLTLVRTDEGCTIETTRTYRAEVWRDDDPPRAGYVAEATIGEGCEVDGSEGSIAIVGTVATSAEYLQLASLEGTGLQRQLARIPRELTPRPPSPGGAAVATIDGTTIIVAFEPPDEDGCAYDQVTYLLAPSGTAALVGFPDRVMHIAGSTYVVVVDADARASRPATHLTLLPLDAGARLVDVDVLIPWMSSPSC